MNLSNLKAERRSSVMKKYEKEDVSENIVEVEEQPGKSLFLFFQKNIILLQFTFSILYFTLHLFTYLHLFKENTFNS